MKGGGESLPRNYTVNERGDLIPRRRGKGRGRIFYPPTGRGAAHFAGVAGTTRKRREKKGGVASEERRRKILYSYPSAGKGRGVGGGKGTLDTLQKKEKGEKGARGPLSLFPLIGRKEQKEAHSRKRGGGEKKKRKETRCFYILEKSSQKAECPTFEGIGKGSPHQ